MKIRQILVPVDYEEESEHALELACEIASASNASLHLLHVYQIPADIYPYTLFVTAEIKEKIREREIERIEALSEKARAKGLAASGHVARGETHEELVRIARELGVDLVVMGTRGRSGMKRMFLGSAAERMVQLAHCPVITTR